MVSPVDLVAYLVGGNEQGLLAQQYYGEHEAESWESLRAQLAEAKGRLVALVEGHSDEDLYGRPWYRAWTMGRMISLNTSSPYASARGRIRAWLRLAA